MAVLLALSAPGATAFEASAPMTDAATLSASQAGTLAQRREQALRATRERRWTDALSLWRALDAERASDPDVSAELGWALLETGQTSEARRQLQRATHLDPMNLRARAGLVLLAIRSHRLDEAVDLATETARARPESADAFRVLGDAQKAAARRSEAEDAYRRAVTLDPGDARAQAGLASVLLIRGKVDEAVKAYREAARLDPSNADYHEGLGRAAMLGGRYGDAALAFATAMDVVRQPAPDWARLDTLTLVALDALSRAASSVHSGGEPRQSIFEANTRILAVTDSLAALPEIEHADPASNPAMAQRSLAYGLMGQAAASDLAALRKDAVADAADAFVLREQARRAVVSARAGAASPASTTPATPPATTTNVTS